MSRAVCPGSFDPVTIGHLDVIGRATELYERVTVAVGSNVSKNALFTPDERVAMLQEACVEWPSVTVTLFSGLLVDFCAANSIDVIVKGLRSGADYDYELAMAQMNRRLTGVDTAFLPTAPELAYVSSSLVREVASLGGDVTPFVTPAVLARITARLANVRTTDPTLDPRQYRVVSPLTGGHHPNSAGDTSPARCQGRHRAPLRGEAVLPASMPLRWTSTGSEQT